VNVVSCFCKTGLVLDLGILPRGLVKILICYVDQAWFEVLKGLEPFFFPVPLIYVWGNFLEHIVTFYKPIIVIYACTTGLDCKANLWGRLGKVPVIVLVCEVGMGCPLLRVVGNKRFGSP
jgi:hypothetical protein